MGCLKKFFRIALCSVLLSVGALGDCVVDQGPYEDEYGYAQFPFTNTCDDSFTVNLCVKSYPPGNTLPVFNLYSGTVFGRSYLTLSNGKWATFDAYKWVAGDAVECPFYD